MNFTRDKSVTISTTIPSEIYREIKQKNLKFSQLILKGLTSEKNFPEMLGRQRELEEKLTKYQQKLETTSSELYKIKEAMR